jgi:hypothetical protein
MENPKTLTTSEKSADLTRSPGNLDDKDIQNNCKYGWVLPDRCRYNARLGCDCGAYPPIKKECICTNPVHGGKLWKCNTEECLIVEPEHPATCKCEVCRFWS